MACDPKSVRNAIANLILDHLQAMKDSLGYWETTHFANAIAALAMNVNSMRQPTTVWLRLCLVDLEKVLAPLNQRNESHLLQDEQLKALTYEQLKALIDAIRENA